MIFNKGEKIIDDLLPTVHVLFSNWKGKRCDFCFQQLNLRKCSGCHFMYYCSNKCQKLDWYPCHKIECKSKLPFILQEFYECLDKEDKPKWKSSKIQMVFRYLVKIKFNLTDLSEINENEYVNNFEKANIIQIASIWTKLNETSYIKHLFENYNSKFFLAFCIIQKFQIRITDCLMQINGLIPEFLMIGEGFYDQLCKYSHNCKPNSAFTFNGIKLTLSIIKNRTNSKKISINYLDVVGSPESIYLPVDIRKNIIYSRGLICKCEMCNTNNLNDEINYKNLMLNLVQLRTDFFRNPNNHILLLDNLIKFLKTKFNELHPTITILLFRKAYFLTINNQWKDAINVLNKVENELYVTHFDKEYERFSMNYIKFRSVLLRGNLNEIQFLSKDFFNVTRFYLN